MIEYFKKLTVVVLLLLPCQFALSYYRVAQDINEDYLKKENAMYIKSWKPHLNDKSFQDNHIVNPAAFIKHHAKKAIQAVKDKKLEHIYAYDGDDVLMSAYMIPQGHSNLADQSSLFMRIVLFKEDLNAKDRDHIWRHFLHRIKHTHPKVKTIRFGLLKNNKKHAEFLEAIGFENTHQTFKAPKQYPIRNTQNMDLWTYEII